MANSNRTMPVGTYHMSITNVKNAAGVDITSHCTFGVVSSDPTVISVGPWGGGGNGFTGEVLKVGSATLTRTTSNQGGSLVEVDTINAVEAPPVSEVANYDTGF